MEIEKKSDNIGNESNYLFKIEKFGNRHKNVK